MAVFFISFILLMDSINESFYFGAMFAWGMFVVSRVVLYVLPFIRNTKRFGRKDPVNAEYMKLKNMEPARIAAEYEKL